ncbi:hypothetical protein [Polyangium aurulentum]|uniref:hypothetical protein n=1 Tax=Polyangium aurulentum TaxID=2567896 RepID=UPI0010AE8613|nr:hypothetical protein [Polyangium aurulentum]UQA57168.1 hypothetical protein E8A73_038650 [Polyangium aurulentum]
MPTGGRPRSRSGANHEAMGGAPASKVVIRINELCVRCPPDEVERARKLVLLADRRGQIPAREMVLLFAWHPERHQSTTLARALGWLGAEIVET